MADVWNTFWSAWALLLIVLFVGSVAAWILIALYDRSDK